MHYICLHGAIILDPRASAFPSGTIRHISHMSKDMLDSQNKLHWEICVPPILHALPLFYIIQFACSEQLIHFIAITLKLQVNLFFF